MRLLNRTAKPTRMRDREHILGVVRDHLADISRTGTLELRSERGRRPAYWVAMLPPMLCPTRSTGCCGESWSSR